MNVRVSVAFARLPDADLRIFAIHIINGMTGNAAFPSPPVSMADLQTAADDFATKLAATSMGGRLDTTRKNASREVLIVLLRQTAAYVQLRSNNDLTILLSSGFDAASTNRSQTRLERPEGLNITNGGEGKLIASVRPVKNNRMYEGRAKGPDDIWLPSVFSGDSRRIIFNGLTPGVKYTIQVRALGGATGQSDWSDPVSHMSL